MSDRPPRSYWLLPLIVAALRALPLLYTYLVEAPRGASVLHLGYIPKDFLAYAAFARQVGDAGSWLFHNPFTVEGGQRFVLLFHALMGGISALTGLDPGLVLELSRVPLLFAFFAVLWWFLRPILGDPRHRLWAAVLAALSGGVEGWVRPLATPLLPEAVAEPLLAATWPLNGWSTFQALYNPLWIAGLVLSMLALRPLLRPEGPPRWPRAAGVAVLFGVAWLTHPYSAIVVAAVAAAVPLAGWAVRGAVPERGWLRLAACLAPVLLGVWLLSRWQSADPGYAAAARAFFGPNGLSVFWYPLTLAAVGLLALRGLRGWIAERHPWRLTVAVWLAVVVLLHSSPVVNGYHFVVYLHLPLCVLAAAPAARALSSPGVARLALAAALFASPLLVTLEALGDARQLNLVPESYSRVTADLAAAPPGNVLAPPRLGNVLPAYTPQRVWVGHWFLTPDYDARSRFYRDLARGALAPGAAAALTRDARIRYLVVPTEAAPALAQELDGRVEQRRDHGALTVLVLTVP